ncbi:hypothetical protein, partial [Candidatus Ventrimonas sp.]|uniref:hypothetical protein n=1 Tax=Candidatus Ventrimonas sp. TaxID=3048889 RepID=UPI003AB7CAD9
PIPVRAYKDRIFRMIFKEKRALLALYNAMNDTAYQDPEELVITTLENAIYLGMKNDVSFMICDRLFLYEHQSTKNPNMPLRNLSYVADLYSVLTKDMFLYGELPVAIPEPRFVVFYNGEQQMEERAVLRLSDLYRPRTEHPYLELETLVLNINKGYNAELMEKCRELYDYSAFVALVREKRKNGMNLKRAVNEAIDECIHQDIMADFLRKNRAEVVKMSIYEYDEEKNYRMLQEQSWERGREKGREEEIISLILKNLKKGCSSAQIADFLDLDKIVVKTVCRLASETAPDYDLEKIYESYWQLTHYDNSIVIKS